MERRISAPTSQEGALQRGKACLSCRRRKMRCDGERPYCTQCIRGNRADDCEYTDNQGRTRTQMLEENVALLQARIHELENPRIASQSVRLHDPYEVTRTRSARQTTIAPGTLTSGPPIMSWWEFEEPPAQITEMLVGTFIPHAASLGFALSTGRFLSEMSLPTLHPERPHPALLHAVFLWALRLSRNHDFTQHENLYLQRSILALQDALGHESDLEGWVIARRRLHAMQAEVLLAQYFFSLDRLLEGRYHANAAVSLAVSCGLHRIRVLAHVATREIEAGPRFGMLELAPARNELEYGERIRVFWAVYVLDRCWSAALGAPCVLTDDAVLGTQIDSAWPMEISDYEQMRSLTSSLSGTSDRTVQRFLSGEPPDVRADGSLSHATLRVMASAVYERTARLSQLWFSQSSQSPTRAPLRTEMQSLARTTMQFARGLVPVDQLTIGGQEGHETLLVVHGLAHATMLTLHSVRASEAPAGELNAINSALVHASEIVKILEKLSGNDSALLDPILSIVGFSAAQVFIREEQRVRQFSERQEITPASTNRLASLRANIARITDALRRCAGASDNSAIFGQQADKISEMMENQ